MINKTKISDFIIKIYVFIFFVILYFPILWILFFSFFNDNVFTFSLYYDLLNNKEMIISFGNSILLAITSSVISVLLGVSGAIGMLFIKEKYKKIIEAIIKAQMINVEIVIALSLSIVFVFYRLFSKFSFFTLLIGHVCLSLPFIYFFIKPKLLKLDLNLYECALDLGCSPLMAIKEVIIPYIFPDILSSFMFSIMLSFDDFVITFFLRGPGLFSGFRNIETLSTFVQAKIKKSPIPPELRALTGLYFFFLLFFVIIFLFKIKKIKKKKEKNV